MEPALAAVAVKVTLVAAQTAPLGEATIETVGADVGLTVMVMPEEVAVAGEAQAKFEVITTVTTWPLVNEFVAKVAEFVPALFPFTFH